MRIGIGYDLHRLVEGRKLILGGVDIPFEKGLLGHSDADVLLHAITDALLGAAALGDIGQHFPDTDPKYKNADSRNLLKNVVSLIAKNGYKIENIDTVVICERPRLSPYSDKIRENIARDLGIDRAAVGFKAKTNEKLGVVGDGLAVIAQAVVLITIPTPGVGMVL